MDQMSKNNSQIAQNLGINAFIVKAKYTYYKHP